MMMLEQQQAGPLTVSLQVGHLDGGKRPLPVPIGYGRQGISS
jgi:hypothetical protein